MTSTKSLLAKLKEDCGGLTIISQVEGTFDTWYKSVNPQAIARFWSHPQLFTLPKAVGVSVDRFAFIRLHAFLILFYRLHLPTWIGISPIWYLSEKTFHSHRKSLSMSARSRLCLYANTKISIALYIAFIQFQRSVMGGRLPLDHFDEDESCPAHGCSEPRSRGAEESHPGGADRVFGASFRRVYVPTDSFLLI